MKGELTVGDRSVSPVIGVVLMVAITVILMAVIGAFILGYNYGAEEPPDSSFDYFVDDTSDDLVIVHTGRQTFTSENTDSIEVYVGGERVDSATETPPFEPNDPITVDSSEWEGGDRIRIVWNSAGGGQAATLLAFNAP